MKRGLIIGTLIVTLLGWTIWQMQQPTGAVQAKLPQWPAFKATQVSTIIIEPFKAHPIRMEKQAEKWMLKLSPPVAAHTENIARLLHDLSNMHSLRIVSHGNKHDAELQLDDDHSAHVQLLSSSGQILLDITVGKQGSDLLSTYIRRTGTSNAVAVDRTLVWQVQRSISDWKAPVSQPAKQKEHAS